MFVIFVLNMTIKNEYDPVKHPKHYNSSKSGIGVIEVTRYLTGSLSNSWKYLCRREHKGTPREDINKAIFYFRDFHKHPVLTPYTCLEENVPLLLEKMQKFIDVEDDLEVKNAMILIKDFVELVFSDGEITPKMDFQETIANLELYAEAIGD